jgi:spore maturation protein CgeB
VRPLDIVVLGLSLSSSWGNGHASTYRALLKALAARGHSVLFLERDQPWYAAHRDLPKSGYCELAFYQSLPEISRFRNRIAQADVVIVGSFVPEGIEAGRYVLRHARGLAAFYDIDTPVTLAKLASGTCDYLARSLIPRYGLYLSFTGGPVLGRLMQDYGSPAARALYCSADPDLHAPTGEAPVYDLGYLGTYSADRQEALQRLLLEPARKAPHLSFIVGGPQYPDDIDWPSNVAHMDHIPPARHAAFYCSCRFVLNITRADMVKAGYSPSVRLFEAAACGVPIISDHWEGLASLFEIPGEIAAAADGEDVLALLEQMPEAERRAMAERAHRRVLRQHTAEHRALEFESYVQASAAGTADLRTAGILTCFGRGIAFDTVQPTAPER